MQKNKWIQHIKQTELCYTEKSPTVYILGISHWLSLGLKPELSH